MKGEMRTALPKKFSRNFSEGLPKPKICEVIMYEKESPAIFGNDARESFPCSLEE